MKTAVATAAPRINLDLTFMNSGKHFVDAEFISRLPSLIVSPFICRILDIHNRSDENHRLFVPGAARGRAQTATRASMRTHTCNCEQYGDE